ncbi:MAG: two component, sigma54 specific, transcriptional regulator, Fis family protein [Ramlibacter sp.]|nr:two component, sigma54 specific, transcriptional regulator, Fis family protein [Ramlibacter sp.]
MKTTAQTVEKVFAADVVPKTVDAIETQALLRERKFTSSIRALPRPLIGVSLPMRRLLDAVECVAAKDVTVLLRGETGTGKEMIATLVHGASRRADKPLVRFNCGALAQELAESQLFGHVKGAFTGAVTSHRGFFAEADGGTLVLDEVGELSLSTQATLLRALQEGEIQPVGSSRMERVDVRIVASTNRDLLADVRAGRFREDLYYRLAVVELVVPPLRDRRVDIPALVEEFARRYAERFGVGPVHLTPELVANMTAAAWPGNVRQLENTVARLVAMSDGNMIDGYSFAVEDPCENAQVPLVRDPLRPEPRAHHPSSSLLGQVDAFEREILARALEAARGNQSETARRLDVCRSTLLDKLKKHGLA